MNSVFSLRGKAAAEYTQDVVDADYGVLSRLSEVAVLFERSEPVTKCRGQRKCDIQMEISSGNRETHFRN